MGVKLEKFWDKDLFVAEAKKRHGDKFNYDKTEPKGACSRVIVNCPVHGDYEVTANGHLWISIFLALVCVGFYLSG